MISWSKDLLVYLYVSPVIEEKQTEGVGRDRKRIMGKTDKEKSLLFSFGLVARDRYCVKFFSFYPSLRSREVDSSMSRVT